MNDLGNKLKELRGSQSQREMAEPLGIKYQQWAKYERGEVAPGADMIKQICLVHACSADWLLGLEGHNPENGSDKTDWIERAKIAESKLIRVNSALKHALKGFEELQEAVK